MQACGQANFSAGENVMDHIRQLSVVLQFVFQGRELLDDGLAFFALFLVCHIADGAVEVVNGAGLGSKHISGIILRQGEGALTIMTGQRSWAEVEAKLDLSEVKYCAAMAGLAWQKKSFRVKLRTGLRIELHVASIWWG